MGRSDRPPDGLWQSYDQKVSPRQGWQGPWRTRPGRHLPRIGNSFGLPAGTTCPGKTTFCEGCYGKRSERQPGVAEALDHNLRLLVGAHRSYGIGGMSALIHDMLKRYEYEARALDPSERIFRIHWDGDFFSRDYAHAWADTAEAHPEIRFWAYTRSFTEPVDVIDILASVENLTLYLSVDADNAEAAAVHLATYSWVRAAYCADDYRHARQIGARARQDDPRRPVPCPENARTVPIAEGGQGACVTCRICPEGRRDIMFATTHRQTTEAPVCLVPRVADTRQPTTHECELPGCLNTFTIPLGKRGTPQRYCSRDCQVEGYVRTKRTRAKEAVG